MSDAYKQAGVDIAAGERAISAFKPLAAATKRAGAEAALGGFGGLFDLKAAGYADPILVSGTDGVGTKLMLAFATGRHDTVGIDLVAMCANDVLAQGAEPLFFLDYFATGSLDEGVAAQVVTGIAEGCSRVGAALIGGETAEMPGMYGAGHYDLAGFCVGAAERGSLLPQTGSMAAGDLMVGLPSTGAHSNGFSLIRKIVAGQSLHWDDPAPFAKETLGQAFMEPTALYAAEVLPLIRSGLLKGMAHITGGGLTENVPRALPEHLSPRYDPAAMTLPPMFEWLKDAGQLNDDDVRATFNCGIGMVLIISPQEAGAVCASLPKAKVIGELGAGS